MENFILIYFWYSFMNWKKKRIRRGRYHSNTDSTVVVFRQKQIYHRNAKRVTYSWYFKEYVNLSEICKPENSTLDLSKMDLTLLSTTFSTTTWNLTCKGYRYFNVSTVPMVTCDVTGWTLPDVECREFAGPTKFSHVSHKQYGEAFMVPLNYTSISTGK